MFEASLIQVNNSNDFIKRNCINVVGFYWIYEGCHEYLKDECPEVAIVSDGIVPSLGGLTRDQLVEGCKDWFGVEL